MQYTVCSYLLGGVCWDLTRNVFCSSSVAKKVDIPYNQDVVLSLKDCPFFWYQSSRDILVEAADSCFCVMLEGWECNLSCGTTSRAQISKRGVNSLQNLQAPRWECCRRVFGLWFSPSSRMRLFLHVTDGYSKPKQSPTPTHHTFSHFNLQIFVRISSWTNKQKESLVNNADLRGLCYMLNYYMQLTYVWCRTISEVLVVDIDFVLNVAVI